MRALNLGLLFHIKVKLSSLESSDSTAAPQVINNSVI